MDGCSFLPKPDLEAGLTRDYDAGGDVPQAKAYADHRAAIERNMKQCVRGAAHHAHDGDAADDVAVARAAGLEVRIVLGSEANYKITTAADLARARAEVAVEEPGEPPRIELVATRS